MDSNAFKFTNILTVGNKEGNNNMKLLKTENELSGDKNKVPLKVAIIAAFLFYLHKYTDEHRNLLSSI
ncbi:hypothetical protein J43TS9_15520 [Paenibacillus cineris]|nr:hypothetical protein J43TS9_15520 [Paenibacillus cineris]